MPDSINREFLEQSEFVRLEQRWEVAYWTRRFGLSEEQLRELLDRVGSRADNIQRYIETMAGGAPPVGGAVWR
jgi:hypothetical protein